MIYRIVFFENDDELSQGEMDDQTFFDMMAENNPAMFSYVADTISRGIRQGNAPQPPAKENFMTMQGKTEK